MSYSPIEEIDEVSFRGKTPAQWEAYKEAQLEDRLSAKLRKLAKEVGGVFLEFLAPLLAFLLAFLIAMGLAYGINLALQGTAANAASLTAFGGLAAITSCAGFWTLAATVRNVGKYYAESMSNNSFAHHNKRDWKQLNDDAIELDTLN